MCAYVCLGGAGRMVGVWVGRVLDWWVWWLVVAEWGWVGQSVAHSAPELSQLVAVAFELSIQIGWRLVSIAAVISSSHCLEIGLPQAMPSPASIHAALATGAGP